jgi:hypothetical protein
MSGYPEARSASARENLAKSVDLPTPRPCSSPHDDLISVRSHRQVKGPHVDPEWVGDLLTDLDHDLAALALARWILGPRILRPRSLFGRHGGLAAFPHHENDVADVDEYPQALPGDEDRILALERV